jgi:hypothetical protein
MQVTCVYLINFLHGHDVSHLLLERISDAVKLLLDLLDYYFLVFNADSTLLPQQKQAIESTFTHTFGEVNFDENHNVLESVYYIVIDELLIIF